MIVIACKGPWGCYAACQLTSRDTDSSAPPWTRWDNCNCIRFSPHSLPRDLEGTPGITLEAQAGRVELTHGVICAMRHIHMSPQDTMEFALRDHSIVRIRVKVQDR